MAPEQSLKVVLRVIGCASLLALIFVVAPANWMNAIHRELGMGPLPDAPVVGYLARSTSAFYAMVGGLFLVVATDVSRYRGIVVYLGIANTLFGVILVIVDWAEGLPRFWKVWEGPFVIAFGLVLLFLARKIAPDSSRSTDPG